MSSTTVDRTKSFGDLLRQWRERRRVSQLALASSAEISTRHLSFVETGRSQPSREMVLRLGEQLDIPLRERNQLLLAAGYAPVYQQNRLSDPEMAAVRDAVRRLLRAQRPHPAVVVDRHWQLLDANDGIAALVDGVAPELLAPPANVLRATLHPDGMAPRIVNLGEWRAHLLGRLRRQVEATADPQLVDLLDELRGYPCEAPAPEVEMPGPGDIFVPLRIRSGDTVLSFLSTVSTFGTAVDVTLAELTIESFFPADAETAALLR